MSGRHRDRHPTDEPGCWACKCLSISPVGYRESSGKTMTNQKRNERELATFAQAVKEGSLPKSTSHGEEALRESDKLGRPFRADKMAETLNPDLAKHLAETSSEMREKMRPESVKRLVGEGKVKL